MNKFNNMKLRNKLFICFGSLVIFSVSMAGLLTYSKIKAYIYDQSSQSYSQTLEQWKMNIDYKMQTHEELLHPYVVNKAFIAALNMTYTSPADYSFQYLDNLRPIFDLQLRFPSIKNIIVYKDNDSLPEIGTFPAHHQLADKAHTIVDISHAEQFVWFKRYYRDFQSMDLTRILKLSADSLWTISGDQTIASIIKPVVYNNEKIAGIVEMRLRMSEIFKETISSDKFPGERLFIMDRKQNILYSSTAEKLAATEYTEEIMRRLQTSPSGYWIMEDRQPAKLVLYRASDAADWVYVREVPLKNLLISAGSILQSTMGILMTSIVVSIVIAIALARVLTHRISMLANHMEGQENLTLDTGPSVDGRDEIGKLTRSYNRMIKRINELIDQLKTSQQLQKESEIKSLQAQINPHFLYNTLATINWMAADKETEKISAMVENLAVFYRLSLNNGKEFLRISEEVNHVRAYLVIQQIRLGDKLHYTSDIEEEILPYLTLKLILQPFVENAILHGAEHKAGITHIHIKGYRDEDDSIVFEVIDDGVGMKQPVHNQYVNNGGYGIHNVNEKIQLQYGHRYGVRLFSEPGKGTKVVIRIPIVRA